MGKKDFQRVRIFAGKKYRYANEFKNRKMAYSMAAAQRTLGEHARVFNDGKMYLLYLRRKSKK